MIALFLRHVQRLYHFSKIQLSTANLIRIWFFCPLKLQKGCGLDSRIYGILGKDFFLFTVFILPPVAVSTRSARLPPPTNPSQQPRHCTQHKKFSNVSILCFRLLLRNKQKFHDVTICYYEANNMKIYEAASTW
jgi:hypothetical protein